MVEPWLYDAETNFDIAQTLARGELGESETQELVETRKVLDLVISPVALDATAELNQGEQIHQLRENGPSDMHDQHRTARQAADGVQIDLPRNQPYHAVKS